MTIRRRKLSRLQRDPAELRVIKFLRARLPQHRHRAVRPSGIGISRRHGAELAVMPGRIPVFFNMPHAICEA